MGHPTFSTVQTVQGVSTEAQLFIEDELCAKQGRFYKLQTQPLHPGRYVYRFRLERAGQSQTRVVAFNAGDPIDVVFDTPNLTTPNYGMDWQPNGATESYSLNHEPITKAEANHLVGSRLTDDSKKLSFTLFGAESTRHRILTDLKRHPQWAALAEKLHVQDYPLDHWLKRYRFKMDVDPSIYLSAPDGTVWRRWAAYDGADDLVEKVRKAHDEYDPAKDPQDQPRPKVAVDFNPGWLTAASLVFLALVCLMLTLWIQRRPNSVRTHRKPRPGVGRKKKPTNPTSRRSSHDQAHRTSHHPAPRRTT